MSDASDGALAAAPATARLAPLLAVLIAIAAQSAVREPIVAGPAWFAPIVELTILVALVLVDRFAPSKERWLIGLRYALGGSLAVSATVSMTLLIDDLLDGQPLTVNELLRDGLGVLVVAVVGFAVVFWQLDRGGPDGRVRNQTERLAFWFPQDAIREYSDEFDSWQPRFLDYLYLSATNVTAFSPTDTMPLTRLAKMLMLWESAVSLATLAVVLARAINILN